VQNLRRVGASAFPYSWQVLTSGGSDPCQVRLGAGKAGSGAGSLVCPFIRVTIARASQPATACAAGRQIAAVIAKWLVNGRVGLIVPSPCSWKWRFEKRAVDGQVASQPST
jgi:hypothetical protein